MKIIILIIFLIKLMSNQYLKAGQIKVMVSNVDDQKGTIHFGVYDDEQFFLSEKGKVYGGYERVSKVLKEGLIIKNLNESRYAIAIFHDRNSNNRFDKIFSIPTEKYGFSNNAKVFFGPPNFNDASFFVGEEATVEIMIELK